MHARFILLCAFLAVFRTDLSAETRPSPKQAVATAEVVQITPDVSEAQDPWAHTVERPGAAFLKPRFVDVDLRRGDVLRVLDGHGREIERITHRGPSDRKHFWGLSVPGDRLTLELRFRHPYDVPPFRVNELMVGDAEVLAAFLPTLPGQSPTKSICAPADFTDAICHQGDAARWANVLATAGILEIIGDQAFFCSGVNVSPRNLVLTTESCLTGTAACENAEFIFGHYREACGSGEVSPNWQSYRCLETVTTSPFGNLCEPDVDHLDFSLHRLDGEPSSTWGYADPDPTALSSGEGLYIVQHADGRPLELTEGSGADVVVDGMTLRYFGTLDTESSSVGAPVFRDSDDRLVALHHCGGCASPTLGNRGVMMSDIEPLIASHLCDAAIELEPASSNALTPVDGNGDSVLDPGETWQFVPRVRNTSCDSGATTVTADFQAGTGSATLVLLDTTSTFPDLAAGAVTDGTPIRFTVDAGQACDGQAVLDMVSIDSNEGTFGGQATYGSFDIGQVPTSTLLAETFDTGIPMAWTVDHQGTGKGEGSTWTTDDPGLRNLFPTPYAIVDSEFLGPGVTMDERLISPVIDTTAYTNLALRFQHHFRWLDGEMDEKADVEVRSGATTGTWTPVLQYQGADAAGAAEADLTTFGAADLEIRFRYYDAEWEWWWAVDDIELLGDNGRVCFTGIFSDGFESGDTTAWSSTVP